MARGRKLTSSRSERYLGNLGYNHQSVGTGNGGAELREEDVWSVGVDEEWVSRASTESNRSFGSYRSRHPAPPYGGLSLAFDDDSSSNTRRIIQQQQQQQLRPQEESGRHVATSAPVNVPDWSKIYRVDSVESLPESDDDSEVVPPHEYLARSRNKAAAANSVFEGVGRTLKGRDLSRVRDAVWSQTGFDG